MTLAAPPPASTTRPVHDVRLEVHTPLPASLRTVALGQFARIEKALHSVERDPDVAVHTARKTMKRLRGLLRLVRDQVGHGAYRAENVVLRDTSRMLAPARDGFVVMRTLDHLRDEYGELLAPDTFATTRKHLLANHKRQRRAVLRDRQLITNVTVNIKSARARFAAWNGDTAMRPRSRLAARGVPDDFSAMSGGLRRVYARGRRGMRLAYATEEVAAFHEWRKRVKYLRYQMETLQPLWPELLGAQAVALDRLGELLGDDHDLAVLDEIVRADDATTANQRERTLLLALIHRARLEHQWQARNLGRAIYAEEPDAFVARMAGYWAAARGG